MLAGYIMPKSAEEFQERQALEEYEAKELDGKPKFLLVI